MRRPIIIVPEVDDFLYELRDDDVHLAGGIIYKNKDKEIIEEFLDPFEIEWFCTHIKEVKKEYKKFILYRYHEDFDLYEYEDYPGNKSGVYRYFVKKYPNSIWDVMYGD